MDDDEIVFEVAEMMLAHLGYAAVWAKNGREMLELYRQGREGGRPFSLVILDLTIPGGMGGEEAIGRLLDMDSQARAIVSSGYSNDPIMADHRNFGFKGALEKPFKVQELAHMLDQAMKT